MRPISVLLVEDNSTFLRMVTRLLQEQHHNEVVVIGAAGGGEEALDQAQELPPDIVLIDLAMPGLPGLVAIPCLRAALSEMGIIALTLLEGNSYRRTALAAGADEFVPKASLSTDLVPAPPGTRSRWPRSPQSRALRRSRRSWSGRYPVFIL